MSRVTSFLLVRQAAHRLALGKLERELGAARRHSQALELQVRRHCGLLK